MITFILYFISYLRFKHILYCFICTKNDTYFLREIEAELDKEAIAMQQLIPPEEEFNLQVQTTGTTSACRNQSFCRSCQSSSKTQEEERKIPAKKEERAQERNAVCIHHTKSEGNDDGHLTNADDDDEEEEVVVIAEEFVRNMEEQQYGAEKMIFAGNGPIKIINPAFRESSSAHKHWPNGRPTVWVEARLFAPAVNLYVCKGHLNHLVDTALIERLHSYTNGMLNRWRISTMDIAREVIDTGSYSTETLQHQFTFARKYVLKAMAGIAEVKTFPIHILSPTALRALVKGVDTSEMAELVHKMANSTYFSIIAHPYTENNNLHIQTRFNMNDKNKKTYGLRPYKMANPEKAIAVTMNRHRFP